MHEPIHGITVNQIRADHVNSGVGASVKHDSAIKHVSGEALYTDDLSEPRDLLHIYIAQSTQAHAKILRLDLDAVKAYPGVMAVIQASDVPGKNDFGAVIEGDPIFADGLVEYVGQSLFAVAAEHIDIARKAAALAQIEYEPLPALITVRDALASDSFVLPSKTFRRGEPEAHLAQAKHRLQGEIKIGGQDHYYLESNIALALSGEDGDLKIFSSTQHPTEIQHCCARVLGVPDHAINVEVRRMGGGFGGKESQPALFASIAALVTHHTGRPSKLRLDRDDDMTITGKRHDYLIRYDVGFDGQGRIQAIAFEAASRCGMSADLSGSINDRTMFHLDNAYYLEHVSIVSHRCKTHTVSNTAFRGFGGPQGMVAIERVIDEIAYQVGKDPLDVRKINFYGPADDPAGRNVTPYFMTVTDNILPEIISELETTADYTARRAQIMQFNRENTYLKKGLSLTPVKFGISFTATHLNQAGALMHIYSDGSIHLNHGGTEMGQGLFTKVAQIVAEEFQVEIDRIKITATTTDKVPNTSPTAASSGCDLNGQAARNAALILKGRLTEFAAEHYSVDAATIRFTAEGVIVGDKLIAFNALIQKAYFARISLSTTGFYSTPKIHFNAESGKGHPFFYFAYGAAVSEVTVDTLTGEYKVDRVDIVHDCGASINPAIDTGQVEGGFIQGMGWLTTEELVYDECGVLRTHAPSTYKIPACGDRPRIMNIQLRCDPNREESVYRSKAVGEPPLMLGISVFNALNDAVASLADYGRHPQIDAPATPERVLMACAKLRERECKPDQALTHA
ncbi:xanthine dehydrogenase molybdopterin binding subunit [Halothiobacillus neapolitanus]|uniref:Xanthine dehydrogenase, molybdopterin binding subunit n=1 Tax=Halothiobacillus neapolitanus (strain ATCC 23641 / DSM 15147 / CIP 104769 / NCIMB 8539 / c2) TaxID=555778 RepID=D0KZ31_HALNC|nr:xanthine dehydrogenase molybdopterin binding subunit [Halothiobacillus neapolitanus]ACX95704.1 xanthine dehydrogenase, molybdopterin binding subunit [Halothiobacillus neapolitanus c2]TDN66010.1 xanthine dehydrogenase molybdenum binding subunit apoprotein [Halothiobacillus neapolitanus]